MVKKRLTIGLLVANLEDVFSNQVCRGAIPAAEALDANLIIFPGKYIDANIINDKSVAYEYQHNTLFSYVIPHKVDILLACLGDSAMTLSQERKAAILKSYGNIPIVTIASRVGGYDYVQFDNKTGLRDGINYLIQTLHKSRIGFVGGPQTNEDACERLAVYRSVLQENNIPVEEGRIVHGNFTFWSENAIETLLDNNPDLDAIVFANDHMAYTGYRIMKERGIQIGKDIAVIGFDDTDFAVKLRPNLATVRADAEALGYRAVMEGYGLISGVKHRCPIVESKFILRDSCGDALTPGKTESEICAGFASERDIVESAKNINFYLFDKFKEDEILIQIEKKIFRIFEILQAVFVTGEMTLQEMQAGRGIFDEILNQNIFYYTEINKAFRVMSIMFDKLYQQQKDENKKNYLIRMFVTCYHKMAYAANTSSEELQSTLENLSQATNEITRNMICFDNGRDDSYGDILEKMSSLHIKSSYIYMFEKPILHHKFDEWRVPKKVFLKAYQDDERVFVLPEVIQRMETSAIYDNNYLPMERRYTMVLSALYSNEYQYGLFLCEFRPEYYHYVETVTYQISAAIKVINLLKNQERIQKELESSLEQIKANNEALDTISKSDELTGLLNRRGFLRAAQKLLELPENQDYQAVVCYLDMDNLKMINDTFGHDDGDFALQGSAKILRKALGEQSVVGRIGGDEFASLTILKNKSGIDSIKTKIKKIENQFNRQCEKPYYVRLSIGSYGFLCKEKLGIQEAMEKADDELYEAKKFKDRNVLKE